MKSGYRGWLLASLAVLGAALHARAQIDPAERQLIQVGYNAAFEGHAPLAAYAFFYHNQPEFRRTNLTLRLAVAPTYLDGELGIRGALGPKTDLGLGLSGGGFADSYLEVRQGKYLPDESFIGHGGELGISVYHLFNSGARIPLNGILRTSTRYSVYAPDDTDPNFALPDDHSTVFVRTGLRWGGTEPVLFPQVAMGISIWYHGQFRTDSGVYGYGDRELNRQSHLFWAEALLAYQTPGLKHDFEVRLSLGTSIDADRFSAYRLGALLPLVSEFPLSLPGYYYQEISARQFVLFSLNYLVPLDRDRHWNLTFTGATAGVDYVDGLEQPGSWHSGVGAGVLYQTGALKVMVGYAYGVDAIRSDGRGAHSLGVLMQLDWGRARTEMFDPTTPSLWRGVQRIFGLFGN